MERQRGDAKSIETFCGPVSASMSSDLHEARTSRVASSGSVAFELQVRWISIYERTSMSADSGASMRRTTWARGRGANH